ncbi:class II aldolase/adducin family protein [Alteripontixanthobacter maritimus]|nr:class II aldolase/adducin family protein [Alteripontixanthobacter maritimus]
MNQETDSRAQAERAIREDLFCAYRLVASMGWNDLIFTHLSARVSGPEHRFLLNPYGRGFEEITASSLIKVDMEGKPVDDPQAIVNPAGFTIHLARDDARCVMHLYTLDGQAVSAMANGLLPLNQTALGVVGDFAYHDYEGVALDHDERE